MPFSIGHHRVSFAIDTGAEVNLLSLAAFKSLTAQTRASRWPLRPPLDILTAVQGAKLTVHGIVTLPVNLSHSSRSVKIDFYVVDALQLLSDRLMGFSILASHDINVFPSRHAIHVNHRLVPALKAPKPLLSRLYDQQVASPGGASHSPWIKSFAPVTLHDLSQTWINFPAVTVGDQLLPPNSACVISIRIKHAPIGTSALRCHCGVM